jgi:hypothetical protein
MPHARSRNRPAVRRDVARGALLAVVCLIVGACGDSDGSPDDPGEVVLHDNLVAVLQAPPPSWQMPPPPQPTLEIQFVYSGEYIVSAGQPWQGVSSQGGTPAAPLEVTVMAGRHKTTPPATWFNQRSALLLGYGLEDSRPDELNFAFTGNLVINGTAYQVHFGQGSDLLGDDWWLGVPPPTPGQPAWTRVDGGYLLTPDGKYLVCPKNGGYLGAHDNAFQVIVPDLAVNCEEA